MTKSKSKLRERAREILWDAYSCIVVKYDKEGDKIWDEIEDKLMALFETHTQKREEELIKRIEGQLPAMAEYLNISGYQAARLKRLFSFFSQLKTKHGN